ncbi:zf-TFIIB domain-containing protein [Maricurvus nonylphenolicus]|uniref:zf-TFIIB domain-containing protein n=1 Tax=Maricurvus nonylphenolicus TaxID=1008307 RepID=UPI0036F2C863
MSKGLWRQHNYLSCIYCNGVRIDTPANISSLVKVDPAELSKRYNCPTCIDANFQHVAIDEHSVEFCNTCKGVFLDKSEIEALFPNLSTIDKITAKADVKNAFRSTDYFFRQTRSVINLFQLFIRKQIHEH